MAKKEKEKKSFEPLFELESENFELQGTYVSTKDGPFKGFCNLIIPGIFSVKVSIMESKKGFWMSLPQHSDGKDWYSDVIPMNKDIAKELSDLAEEAGAEFEKC